MIEDIYEMHRNANVIDGLYGFIMTDQIGLILYESENMGNPEAKLITATRLLVAITCPDQLSKLNVNFVPNNNSLLHEDATKLCVGDQACLPEVEKAIFSDLRCIASVSH